jgi:hypothetical protein
MENLVRPLAIAGMFLQAALRQHIEAIPWAEPNIN